MRKPINHDNCEIKIYIHPWETHHAKIVCKQHNCHVQWLSKADAQRLESMGVETQYKVRKRQTIAKAFGQP